MKKIVKIGIILTIILMAGILGAVLGNMYIRPPPIEERQEIIEKEFVVDRNITNTYTTIKSTITTINIALCIILIFLYFDIYRKVHSEFTIGLIITMFALLIYAITSNPLFYAMFGFRGFGMGPFLLIPDLFTTLALSVLLYLSLK